MAYKTSEDWLNEGDKHFDNKNYEDAEICFKKALRINPNYEEAKSKLKLCNNEQEDSNVKIEEKVQDTNHTSKINPKKIEEKVQDTNHTSKTNPKKKN